MNKHEIIKAAINGENNDYTPYAIWTHLPGIDLDPELLAEKTYDFYKEYDVDFVKTMNNGMYPIEDFGCIVDYSEIEKGGVAKIIESPIESIDDWDNVKAVDINKGAYARELKSLNILLDKLDGEVPVVFTVFSPMTIADKLCGGKLLEYISSDQHHKVKEALEAITETTANLAAKAIEMGASGVFFATQLSSYDITTEDVYLEYGYKYDSEVLKRAGEGWFNVLHAHGNNIMFNILKDYPVQVINWHVWETLPDIDEARIVTDKCLMGGLGRMDITNKNINEINNQIYKSLVAMENRRHILTPGCVLRYPLDNAMMKYVKESKISIEEKLKASASIIA